MASTVDWDFTWPRSVQTVDVGKGFHLVAFRGTEEIRREFPSIAGKPDFEPKVASGICEPGRHIKAAIHNPADYRIDRLVLDGKPVGVVVSANNSMQPIVAIHVVQDDRSLVSAAVAQIISAVQRKQVPFVTGRLQAFDCVEASLGQQTRSTHELNDTTLITYRTADGRVGGNPQEGPAVERVAFDTGASFDRASCLTATEDQAKAAFDVQRPVGSVFSR